MHVALITKIKQHMAQFAPESIYKSRNQAVIHCNLGRYKSIDGPQTPATRESSNNFTLQYYQFWKFWRLSSSGQHLYKLFSPLRMLVMDSV